MNKKLGYNKIENELNYYIGKLRSKLEGKNLYYTIRTFGCQMNEHDSEKMSWILESIGYKESKDESKVDLILYNTCAIRQSAENKVLGHLGQLKKIKRENPNMILAVGGCMTQIRNTAKLIEKKYDHVDIIFGTNNIESLPKLIYKSMESKKTVIDILDKHEVIDENVGANRLYNYKAFVNIMYGCNNFCSYCIVPYTRGREISRQPENIIKEIKDLVSQGTKEVTLLGQNVNSYGKTLKRDYNFTDLLNEVNKIEGLERIRFMTSHPKDISDELIEAYGRLDKLSKHLHLPVQSGSNKILKDMNRKYTREAYLEKVNKIRQVCPDIVLTTDIIVGFPGESEEDFKQTLDLVKEVEYDSAFTFLYSIREGTPAARSKEQIDPKIKHDRFERLVDILNDISLRKNQKYIGKIEKVLVEGTSKNDPSVMTGRNDGNKVVNFKASDELIGKIVNVKIKDCTTFTLNGELI